MSNKMPFTTQLNWTTTTPVPYRANVALSGVTSGSMTGTGTLYSQILEVSRQDNLGIEVSWTGTPTGTLSVLGSASGTFFFPLTFTPPLTQPAGASGGYGIDLNQFPWRFFVFEYVNVSGTGNLTAYLTCKGVG
jgi:hypothetical protein